MFAEKTTGGFCLMITVEHLTKCYGDFTAVKDLSFEIGEGHVYGFLGPNGAGKSTTMNIMTGCLSPTDGRVTIDGYDILEEPDKAKRLIGYLPEQPPLYLNETPEEYLRFVGEAKGLKGAELKAQIEEVMEQTKITDMRNRRIAALSKGYKQRVGIAQALLGNPKVIILDEPTVGLDPIQIIEIRDLIKQLGQTHTVILSSHILSEVQTICEKILIIAKGKLIAYDEPEKLENQLMAPNEILFTTEATADETKKILGTVNPELVSDISVQEKEDGFTGVHIKTAHDNIYDVSRAIFFAFAERQKALLEMSLKKANLEDIFIELTTAGGQEETAEPAEELEQEEAFELTEEPEEKDEPAEEIKQSEEGEQS
jgi:ABC-2 type transport system ATP-binding protein